MQTYFLGEACFSIYETMSKLLDETGVWKRESNAALMEHCDLILGDRFGIKYQRLRAAPRPSSMPKRLVNYFQGSHRLTLKGAMTQLLRDVPDVDEFLPKSFVVSVVPPTSTCVDVDASSGAAKLPGASVAECRRAALRRRLGGGAMPLDAVPSNAGLGSEVASKDKESLGMEADQLKTYMAAHPDYVWIVKPSAGSKGKGIFLATAFDDIERQLLAPPAASPTTAEEEGGSKSAPAASSSSNPALFVVQRYIANPLLIGGRKFDIRVWALLVSPFRIFVYSQGSCRTASVPFSMSDISSPFAHITNHDLQQHSATYGEHEAGNELWYSALEKHLHDQSAISPPARDEDGKQHPTFDEVVQPQINDIVRKTLLAAKDLIEVPGSEPFGCFQLFGYDMMLDDALRVHLIEINGSPGAAQRWLEPLVNGVLEVAIDGHFAVPCSSDSGRRRHAESTSKDGEEGHWICIH